jgi:cytochrome c oxidase subunit 3
MASASAVLEHTSHQHGSDEQLWSGGKEPFKASYGKLMMWYFLLSDAFTFAGFLISYGALRFSSPTWPVPDFVFSTAPFGIHEAPLIFVTFMTFVLIASSVTMVRAVQEGHRENKRGVIVWMFLTILGGATFLGCQAWEWTTLIGTEGVTITTDPFSMRTEGGQYLSGKELESMGFSKVEKEVHGTKAVYYLEKGKADLPENRYFEKIDHFGTSMVGQSFERGEPYLITYNHNTHLYETAAYKSAGGEVTKEAFGPKAFGALFFFITGFHGFHVFSGVVFLTIVLINVASGIYARRNNRYEMVEKIGLYWHFVDLVWVFVFLVFYLL